MKKLYALTLTALCASTLTVAAQDKQLIPVTDGAEELSTVSVNFPLMSKKNIVLKLLEIGAIKFGEFTLNSGKKSPIYVDMRVLVSYPNLLCSAAYYMNQATERCDYKFVCGVPMGAIPIATTMMNLSSKPFLLMRPVAKEHGTKKMIEGAFQPGETSLVVEDVATTGTSILKTIQTLQKEGLQVKDVAVFVNRQQGATKALAEKGHRLHSVFTISEIVEILAEEKALDERLLDTIRDYLKVNMTEP